MLPKVERNFEHGTDSYFGLAVLNGQKALVCDWNGTIEHETLVLAHEFGHLFGAEDHYGSRYAGAETTDEINERKHRTDFSENCIYGGNKEELDSIIICSGCLWNMQSQIN